MRWHLKRQRYRLRVSQSICGLLLTLGCGAAEAQLNQQRAEDTWHYQLAVSGSLLQGNIARNLLLADARAEYFNSDWGVYQRVNWQLGSFGERLSENDLVVQHFAYLWPTDTWYPYLMAWLESNLRRQITGRLQLGPGLTYQPWNSAQHSLKVSGTLTGERSVFAGADFSARPDLTQNTLDTLRLTLRLAGQDQWTDTLRISYEGWVQPALLDLRNLRGHAEVAAHWQLQPQLSFKTSLNYSYESVHLDSVAAQDLMLTFGLAFHSETP